MNGGVFRRLRSAASVLPTLLVAALTLAAASPAAAQVTALSLAFTDLREVDLITGETLSGVTLSEPVLEDGVTLSASGQLLAFAGDRLLEIDQETGVVTTVAQFDLGEDDLVLGLGGSFFRSRTQLLI